MRWNAGEQQLATIGWLPQREGCKRGDIDVVGPEAFLAMKLQRARWLAKEIDISEDEAFQIVENIGFNARSLRREARLFKQSKRAKG